MVFECQCRRTSTMALPPTSPTLYAFLTQDRLELRKRASHADLSLALAEFSMPLEPTLLVPSAPLLPHCTIDESGDETS